MPDFVRRGGTLVVTPIDRVARPLKDLQNGVPELKGRGLAIRATEQSVNTGTVAGKAFLNTRVEACMSACRYGSATPAVRSFRRPSVKNAPSPQMEAAGGAFGQRPGDLATTRSHGRLRLPRPPPT